MLKTEAVVMLLALAMTATVAGAQPIPIIHPNPGGGGGGGSSVVTDNVTVKGNGASAGNPIAIKAVQVDNTSVTGTGAIGSPLIAPGGVGGATSNQPGKLDTIYNVVNFGAKGDAVNADDVPIQAAIDAACAASNQRPASVYFPATSGLYYKLTQPLFLHCTGLRLFGPGQGNASRALLTSNSSGPILVVQGFGMSPPTQGTPLITNSTASFSFNGLPRYRVQLDDVPRIYPATLSTFNLDAYVNLTALPGAQVGIVSRVGTLYSGSGDTYAYLLGLNSSNQFIANLTVGGTKYTLTDATDSVTTATLYNLDLDYDGAKIRFFVNGVMRASQVITGNVTQNYWESVGIGGVYNGWGGNNLVFNPINGLVDGIHISQTSRHGSDSSYSPCNCEPTLDANSLVIASNDTVMHMLTQVQWESNGTTPQTMWVYPQRVQQDNGGGENGNGLSGIQLADLVLSSNGTQITGVVGSWMTNSYFDHLGITGYQGLYLFNNDFNDSFSDIQMQQSTVSQSGFVLGQSNVGVFGGAASNIDSLKYLKTNGFSIGMSIIGGSWTLTGASIAAQNNTYWELVVSAGGELFAVGPSLDVELSGSVNLAGDMLLDSGVASFDGLFTGNSSTGPVPVVLANKGGPYTFSTVAFSANTGTAEYINIPNPPTQGRVLVENSSKNQASVPWTNDYSSFQLNNGNPQPCRAGAASVAANTTNYIACGQNAAQSGIATEASAQVAAPGACLVSNLSVKQASAANTNTPVYTVNDGGAGQALTCTIANTATTCTDTAHSFITTAGDMLDLSVANPASANATGVIQVSYNISC